jgi:crossover junction endodeoxyribonuclease RuvC
MLKLGRAQGVVMAAALSRQIPIVEYSPKTVKQSVTSQRKCFKEQVASMLDHLLKMKLEPEMFDATDALGLQYVIIFMAIILWQLIRVRKKAGQLLSMKTPIELNKVALPQAKV